MRQLDAAVDGPVAASRSGVPPVVWAAALAVLMVAAVAGIRRGRRAAGPGRVATGGDAATTAATPRIWLVMTPGGLEGPMSLAELADRARACGLGGDAKVRRQGEVVWRRLDELVDRP
jgi:hypothetical protein